MFRRYDIDRIRVLFFSFLFFLILGSMGDTTRARLLGTSRSAVLFSICLFTRLFFGDTRVQYTE